MKDKNFPLDNIPQSLAELTKQANNIVQFLEEKKSLKDSIEKYQELLRLNNIIEKKFQKISKSINEETKKKIDNIISKKNEK